MSDHSHPPSSSSLVRSVHEAIPSLLHLKEFESHTINHKNSAERVGRSAHVFPAQWEGHTQERDEHEHERGVLSLVHELASFSFFTKSPREQASSSSQSSHVSHKSPHTHMSTHTVAVKQFRYSSLTPHVWDTFVCEAAFLARHTHPNIVLCFGFFSSPSLSLVLEWVDTDLHRLLLSPLARSLSLVNYHTISRGLACACEYMHSQRVLHRDLKPHNILLTHTDYTPKLCDFGLSVSLNDGIDLAGDKKGTSGWAAPEVMGGGSYGLPADVYSYGLCVWAMCQPGEENPFCGMTSSGGKFDEKDEIYAFLCVREDSNEREKISDLSKATNVIAVYYAAIRSGKRPPLSIAGPFASLIRQCWAFDPAARPTFTQITQDLIDNEHVYCTHSPNT